MRASVSVFAVVSLLALLGCGPVRPPCSPSTCLGCCDAMGMCRGGSEATACGASGAACTVCGAGSTCSFGTCGSNQPGGTGGGSAGGGTSTGAVPDWASFCREAGAATAAFSGRCGEYTAMGAEEYRQTYVALCQAAPPPGLADGRSRYEPTGARQCLAEIQAASCAIGPPSGCLGLLTGLVPLNGSCFAFSDCAAGLCATPRRCVRGDVSPASPSASQPPRRRSVSKGRTPMPANARRWLPWASRARRRRAAPNPAPASMGSAPTASAARGCLTSPPGSPASRTPTPSAAAGCSASAERACRWST
jgi:hypothetical protein